MEKDLTEFEHLTEDVTGFVFEAIDLGLRYAELVPAGFLPFARTMASDGALELWRLLDDEDDPTHEGSLALGREKLREVDPTTRCVSLTWDGYLTLEDYRTEAVYVEAYQLGQPAGVLLAQRYDRSNGEIGLLGNPVLLDDPDPLVPPTTAWAAPKRPEWP